MMHLMEAEWAIIRMALLKPHLVADMLPLESKEEVEALCEDIRESLEYNHHNPLETRIISACIDNSDIHNELKDVDLPYAYCLDIVDAAYSLQDRFAARFPVTPSKWMDIFGSNLVDANKKRH